MKKFSPLKTPMKEPQYFLPYDNWTKNTCGGCGSKIDASALSAALNILGLDRLNEDAAKVEISNGHVGLQSIDQFRTFISDPYVFGEISLYHAVSDIYAMGGVPTNIMVGLSLPAASADIHKEDIIQTMSGIVKGLKKTGAKVVGGHSNETAEATLAISVQGEINERSILLKKNLKPGDQLILTKPIGTGVVLAGHMEGRVQGAIIEESLKQMKTSNHKALLCLQSLGVSNCTDVTGFGLAGHLKEMLTDQTGASLIYSQIRSIPGVQELFNRGIRSSISHKNALSLIESLPTSINDKNSPLLFDPQTSGGLLFSIAPHLSAKCIDLLKQSDCPNPSIIGSVTAHGQKIEIAQ